MMRDSERILEGSAQQSVTLNKIYTQLFIINDDSDPLNREHEIWQIETTNDINTSAQTVINYNEILKPPVDEKRTMKIALTKGIAGIGKTVTVQKFVHDWASGEANQDLELVFLLPFRELNLHEGENQSLFDLLCVFYPELPKEPRHISDWIFDRKVLFILDGLDEYKNDLNFQANILSDVTKKTTLDVLLVNLLGGKLLPSAHLWITSRPVAAGQLPSKIFKQGYVTQIRGFTDEQKEEYFTRKFEDPDLTQKVIRHLKSHKSLWILCHIPLFCWISSVVLKNIIKSQNKDRDMPSNQTEMYIHYLLNQTTLSHNKYQGKEMPHEDALIEHKELIKKLAELAYWKLKERNTVFSKEDLRKYYITPDDALRYPGIITCVSECKVGYKRTKLYSFVHLSVQEFFAALFVFHEFLSEKQDSLGLIKAKKGQNSNLSDFLKGVIDVAVQSKNEHLDLFNCFLFGISCDSSRQTLEGFLPPLQGSSSEDHKKVTKYIKSLRRKNLSPERCFSLVRCLVELKDMSFLQMQNLERSRTKKPLTLFQCTFLAFRFVTSDTDHEEFVLRKYNMTLEGFQRFSPAIKCFRKAQLEGSGFTEKHCDVLVSFLTSPKSHLTHLDLSHNSLGLSALKQISRALCDPNCQIQMLNLSHNELHSQDMELIKDVLSGSNVNLKILDLSDNHVEDRGAKILSAGLRRTKCHLEVLKLSGCQIKQGVSKLLSSLKANPSLRELDLQYNDLGNMEQKVRLLKAKLPSLRYCSFCLVLVHVEDAVALTFDPQTANEHLYLSENNTVAVCKREKQQLPANDERFDKCNQVLCCQPLSGRCFFTVDVIGTGVHMGVACKEIKRKGASDAVRLGRNKMSWSLCCSKNVCVAHNKKTESLTKPLKTESTRKLGVFVDQKDRSVFFYRLSPEPELLYMFDADFPEDQKLYAAFSFQELDSSVCLRQALL
ncbi:NLR family CARD domain-containing protein 3 [Anabarilius grahami]|uniref:NLR family CARD domain-containing protein 3 n=1 Tax=Anabarilius grahami TaxID=495550 RepID=A0A3N0ZAR1_ANAGA|nr:NLR family CARD domain-containing protein 3 [Anabarilius grahami]